jgi:hypothetical protein
LFIKICDYTGWTMDRVYRSCTRTQRERWKKKEGD